MILHTLVFSFGDDRSAGERDEFLHRISEIVQSSGMAAHIATAPHLPAEEDVHAPVFVSSAICQVLVADMETLGRLSAHQPLVDFEQEQQELKPYRVVWVNSAPLDLTV